MAPQTNNKRLGILGLGNRSTLFYIDRLNKQYNKMRGEFSTCPFLLYNTDFSLLNPFLPNNFEKLVPQLAVYLDELKDVGVTQLLIPNITLHQTLDQLACGLSIIHPVELTIQQLKKINVSEAVVFGSKYTMGAGYLRDKFSEQGIKLISPTVEEMVLIDKLRKQVYNEVESEEELVQFHELINSYSSQTTVVLACTELSIVTDMSGLQVVDMALCQIDKAVRQ